MNCLVSRYESTICNWLKGVAFLRVQIITLVCNSLVVVTLSLALLFTFVHHRKLNQHQRQMLAHGTELGSVGGPHLGNDHNRSSVQSNRSRNGRHHPSEQSGPPSPTPSHLSGSTAVTRPVTSPTLGRSSSTATASIHNTELSTGKYHKRSRRQPSYISSDSSESVSGNERSESGSEDSDDSDSEKIVLKRRSRGWKTTARLRRKNIRTLG